MTAHGSAQAEITDDGVSVGPVTIAFLDADTLRAADYRIEIGCWPAGTLVLTELGRRFDTFAAELRRARDHARVAGLLAHGTAMPVVFTGAVLGTGAPRPADCHVYDTHVTFVPIDADQWQLPLGALTASEAQDDPPAVAELLDRIAERAVLGLRHAHLPCELPRLQRLVLAGGQELHDRFDVSLGHLLSHVGAEWRRAKREHWNLLPHVCGQHQREWSPVLRAWLVGRYAGRGDQHVHRRDIRVRLLREL